MEITRSRPISPLKPPAALSGTARLLLASRAVWMNTGPGEERIARDIFPLFDVLYGVVITQNT